MAFSFASSFCCHCSLLKILKATSTNWESFTPNAPFNVCNFLLISDTLSPKKQSNWPFSYFQGSRDLYQDSICSLINIFQKFRGEAEQRNCLQVRSWATWPFAAPTHPVCQSPDTTGVQVETPSSWSPALLPQKQPELHGALHEALEDGKKSDSSQERNKPFKFVLVSTNWVLSEQEVIWGWNERVAQMCLGHRAKPSPQTMPMVPLSIQASSPQMATWSVWELLNLEWPEGSPSWAPHSWMCHTRIWFLQLCTANLQVASPDAPLLSVETSSLADSVLSLALLIPFLLTWVLTWTMGHKSRYSFSSVFILKIEFQSFGSKFPVRF